MKWLVEMVLCYPKVVTVYAEDSSEAKQIAEEMCKGWHNVVDCYASDVRDAKTGY